MFFVCFCKTNTKNGLASGLISELIIFMGGSGTGEMVPVKSCRQKNSKLLPVSTCFHICIAEPSLTIITCHYWFENEMTESICAGLSPPHSDWDSAEDAPAPHPGIISSVRYLQSGLGLRNIVYKKLCSGVNMGL